MIETRRPGSSPRGERFLDSPQAHDETGATAYFCKAARAHVRKWPRFRRLAFEPLEGRRLLAVLNVNSLSNTVNPGDGLVTLPEAIAAANNDTTTELNETGDGPDEIRFAGSLFSGGPATMFRQGELEITEALTITGPGANLLTINAQQVSRIFNITATTGDFTFAGLSLTGGRTTSNNLSILDNTFSGGAIRTLAGNLTVANSIVTGNSTAGEFAGGGAIYAAGNIILANSTVSSNRTTGQSAIGGALYAGGNIELTNSTVNGSYTTSTSAEGGGLYAAGNVTLTNSTVSGNRTEGASSGGGGVFASGNVTATNSTVSGNSTAGNNSTGGGILAEGVVTLTGSAVSGNSAAGTGARGGGILALGGVAITSSTISGNSATAQGGGIWTNDSPSMIRFSTIYNNRVASAGDGGGVTVSGLTLIDHAIIARNGVGPSGQPTTHDDIRGAVDVRFSLIGNGTGVQINDLGGNIVGSSAQPINPMLAPLADNGGPTQTHALLATSPARDAGDFDFQPPPNSDQRGAPFIRRFGQRVDLGAFELQPVTLSLPPTQFRLEGEEFDLFQFILFEDVGTGPYTATVDWGDGSQLEFPFVSNGRIATRHIYRDNLSPPSLPFYTVQVQLSDLFGPRTGGFNILVGNIRAYPRRGRQSNDCSGRYLVDPGSRNDLRPRVFQSIAAAIYQRRISILHRLGRWPLAKHRHGEHRHARRQ